MILKFKLFEAQKRHYGTGTLFSDNHRMPNLPEQCAMIDIDGVSISENQINAIIEDKFKFDSKSLGNPLEGEGTWQRKKLVDICKTLRCPLILCELSTKTYIKFDNNLNPEKIDSIDDYSVIETANRIFVEIRFGRPKAIMFRIENIKVDDLPNSDLFKSAMQISQKLNCELYIISDDYKPGKIYIRKYFKEDGQKSPTYVIDYDNPISWVSVYKQLNLL